MLAGKRVLGLSSGIKQKSTTDSRAYRLFCAFLRMFTGIDACYKAQARVAGSRKNVPGIACSVDEAVAHLSRWFFMTYKGKLKAYEVTTLNLKTTRFPTEKFFFKWLKYIDRG